MAERLYFAYGSNINLDQMAHRCPDATPVGPVMLENYELIFRGTTNHGGVATIRPRHGSYVYGLMWNLTPECEKSLDRYEGYPHLYRKETVTVFDVNGREIPVMVYVMNDRYRKPSIPSDAYYLGIREGFRQNRLPVKHLEKAIDYVHAEIFGRVKSPQPSRTNKPKSQGKEAR